VTFETSGIPAVAQIPLELFDSVAENLLQNALSKRRTNRGLSVQARLDWQHGSGALSVCDDGEALSEGLASRLFQAPVTSANGLGVGLYQCARQAVARGYRLALTRNEQGGVCFQLLAAAAAAADVRADGQPPPCD
jgi:C4-dicarboxylate-specific signal transduction histidine kinase